ncbi:MAG: helix-turn-helix domain-containing protein [Gemmatimonadaceae bacterium]|nr:helix-turn-helix domain-containing protein [Gemmatimonadaceae bacterium]
MIAARWADRRRPYRATLPRAEPRVQYRAWRADGKAHLRARRPKTPKLAVCPRLRAEVERGLARRCSPQQIAARLVCDFPDDPEMRVSHETIYQSLFVQGRGALRQELTRCLRSGRAQRRPHGRVLGSGQLKTCC